MLSKNHHHRATFGSIQDDEEQVFLNEKKTSSSSSSLSSSSSYSVVHKFALTCLLAIVGALAFLGNDNAFVPAAPMRCAEEARRGSNTNDDDHADNGVLSDRQAHVLSGEVEGHRWREVGHQVDVE